jgi:hypothetical protein
MAQKMVDDKKATVVEMFKGNSKHNLGSHDADSFGRMIVEPSQAIYNGSAGEAKLMAEIEQLQKLIKKDIGYKLSADEAKKFNAAQYPGQTAVEALLGKVYIDITRRAQGSGDLTSLFATEANDPNSDATVNVNYFYQYIGKFGQISGTNDSINLIEQKLGGTDTFNQAIYALGWKDTLQNMLFNKVHDMAKVNQAAADADADNRNNAIIGTIVGATYVASQKEAADTTGTTFDVKNYNTMRKAIKKLRSLDDPQTSRNIVVPQISILCNSLNTWDIQRVISGQLGSAGGVNNAQNLQALPISNIIEYDQGITDGYTYGKDTLSFPGVTAGKCYMFVPNEYMFVMNKRGLTLETGMGSTLQLSTEERAWYRVFGVWMKDFLGSSYPGTSLGAGYGSIIEVTLPADS